MQVLSLTPKKKTYQEQFGLFYLGVTSCLELIEWQRPLSEIPASFVFFNL